MCSPVITLAEDDNFPSFRVTNDPFFHQTDEIFPVFTARIRSEGVVNS